ncbi:MAG: phytanoyl-CoA dioxygenase family protein [Pseudomonadota bacterium]
MAADPHAEFEETGRLWIRQALSEQDVKAIDAAAAAPDKPGARLKWTGAFEETLGTKSKMARLIRGVMPGGFPIRLVAFNKTPASNWSVPWHQDRVVALAERHDTAGFRNWSRKAGIWHAEPPADLLSSMLFARIHLDDTDEANGCLELALGTHHLGLIPGDQAAVTATEAPREICRAARGDVLLVKALTLHRSLSSQTDGNRKALRVDYANTALPAPLEWSFRRQIKHRGFNVNP